MEELEVARRGSRADFTADSALAEPLPATTAPVASKQGSSFYRPELDALRFFAFLLVFLCHAVTAGRGWMGSFRTAACLGVCLFFVLSSYLICELLERERSRFGDINLRSFYARRALRIWPLYFALLIADFGIERVLNPGVFSYARLFAYFFLAGNIYAAAHGFTLSISTPLWSISVEEQFYLIWPTVRKFLTVKVLVGLSILMYLQSFATLWFLGRNPLVDKNSVWVNSLVQFQYFSTGCLLGLALRGKVPKYPWPLRLVAFGLGFWALMATQTRFHFKDDLVPVSSVSLVCAYLLGNLACLLFFLSFLGEERLGGSRAIVYLGKISYGMYIFHWAMIRVVAQVMARLRPEISPHMQDLVRLCVSLVLTVAVASLSYKFFETPILRYKRRFERVQSRAI